MYVHLTVEQRQLALRLKARGLSLRAIGPQAGCSHQSVALGVRHASRRPVRQHGWVPGPGRLTLAGREEITLGLHAGESFTGIAGRLGKAPSTVSREVAANGGRGDYRAWRAHQRACQQARRPKACKLAFPQLAAKVTCWLTQWWPPVQISARLRIEFPGPDSPQNGQSVRSAADSRGQPCGLHLVQPNPFAAIGLYPDRRSARVRRQRQCCLPTARTNGVR